MIPRQRPSRASGQATAPQIVYVRSVDVGDLPEELRAQAGDLTRVYAVHDADGARLALVRDRRTAFLMARRNHMDAVTAH